MEISTGVDHYWIADATLAFKESMRRSDITTEERIAFAAAVADAMEAERRKRGGVRDANDLREMLAVAQEAAPALLKLLEDIGKISAKNRKGHGEDR